MSQEKWIFGTTAIGFAGVGIAMLIFPNLMGIVGVKELTNSGTVEIRALSGGLELGIGLFFLLALNRPKWASAALVAQVCLLGGLSLGRILGLVVIKWHAKPIIYLVLAAELLLAILGAITLISYKKTKKKNEFGIIKNKHMEDEHLDNGR